MNTTTLVAPAAEPVGLAEAKAYLRIGSDADDALVGTLVAASRSRIEAASGVAMIARTLRVTLSRWPAGMTESRRLRLPVRPASGLTAVRVFSDSDEAEVVTSRFAIERGRNANLVWINGVLPWPGRKVDGIEIDYVAGQGAEPEDVSEGLRLAVKRLSAHAYLARDGANIAGPLPEDVAELLAPWRVVRL